eukprot:CAMPEP_0204327268 /NCGR_PEP_ID=MMETSP0469-20131031/12456_1 /ASSEMBLY_ACC=CAM_ASM_000384 /TAXON_ID=2969 /ORGANISM="Oxyrrhis marina" /LENGTH=59 /DNA_ID=CAMNT_0051309465 /DNA_START=57 /DNA_END=233 /DNA_ORIENTATION=-
MTPRPKTRQARKQGCRRWVCTDGTAASGQLAGGGATCSLLDGAALLDIATLSPPAPAET